MGRFPKSVRLAESGQSGLSCRSGAGLGVGVRVGLHRDDLAGLVEGHQVGGDHRHRVVAERDVDPELERRLVAHDGDRPQPGGGQ